MKQKIIYLSLVCICLCTLCLGCQKMPEEVENRIQEYGDNKQVDSEELVYCSIEELQNTDISNKDFELDNMVIPDEVDFSNIEGVEVLDLAYEKNYIENQQKYIDIFKIDPSTSPEIISDESDSYVTYDNKSDREQLQISDGGFISYYSGLSYDYFNDEEDSLIKEHIIEKKYDLYNEDISQVKVNFGKEEAKLSQICTDTEKWLDENVNIDKCEYHISDVYIRNNKYSEGKKKQLSLMAEVEYKGIRFNNYAFLVSNEGETGKLDIITYGVNLNYDGIDQLSYFTNTSGKFVINSSEVINKVVSPESAVKLVNRTLAGFNKIKFDRIIPLYALYPEYDSATQLYSGPGQVVKGRPVYAFLIRGEEDDSEMGIHKVNSYKSFFFVDMVTGEFTTNIDR